MAIPSLPCTSIEQGPVSMCVSLPGGCSVCLSYPTSGIPSAIAVTKQLLAEMAPALSPLAPFFNVLECLQAAPQLIFNPDPFITALLKMAAMVPALSVPILAVNCLDILIAYLTGLKQQLVAFVAQEARLAEMATKATALGCPQLQLQVDCATAQVSAQMTAVNDGMGPLNGIVSMLNIFLGLIGGPTVPPLSSLGSDPAAALAPLQAIIDALQAVRDSIPI